MEQFEYEDIETILIDDTSASSENSEQSIETLSDNGLGNYTIEIASDRSVDVFVKPRNYEKFEDIRKVNCTPEVLQSSHPAQNVNFAHSLNEVEQNYGKVRETSDGYLAGNNCMLYINEPPEKTEYTNGNHVIHDGVVYINSCPQVILPESYSFKQNTGISLNGSAVNFLQNPTSVNVQMNSGPYVNVLPPLQVTSNVANMLNEYPPIPIYCWNLMENYQDPHVNTQGINYPYVNTNIVSGNNQLQEGLRVLQLLYPSNQQDNQDEPEYIDITNLNVPTDDHYLSRDSKLNKNNQVPLFLRRNRGNKSKTVTDDCDFSFNFTEEITVISEDDEDDDVVFVSETQLDDKVRRGTDVKQEDEKENEGEINVDQLRPENVDELRSIKQRKKRKLNVVTRRNPKRLVQQEKESISLAKKLSGPVRVFSSRVKRTTKFAKEQQCRRSSRITGAMLNPPSPLSLSDIKEWPIDGMHERPEYNEDTKNIEKFDFTIRNISVDKIQNYKQADLKKFDGQKCSTGLEEEPQDHFANFAEERLLLLVEYIKQWKLYNNIKLSANHEKQQCAGKSTFKSKKVEKQTKELIKMLKDACWMFSLTGYIDKATLIRYVKETDPTKANRILKKIVL